MKYRIEITTVYTQEADSLDELHKKWQQDGVDVVAGNHIEVYDENDNLVDEWDD